MFHDPQRPDEILTASKTGAGTAGPWHGRLPGAATQVPARETGPVT